MAPPNISGPRRHPLPPRQPVTTRPAAGKTPAAPTTQKKSPAPAPQPVRAQPSLVFKDGFDRGSVRPSPLSDPRQNPLLAPMLSQPLMSDEFIARSVRISKARPLESLSLPVQQDGSVTAQNVPLPTADSKPTAAQAHVALAAQSLGFSPEVSSMAAGELARRLGDTLVVNLKSKKNLVTAEDFKNSAPTGATTAPFTFNAAGLAVVKDANLTASLGLTSMDELYTKQGEVLSSLRQDALAGADMDPDEALKLVNDPATREGMAAYYDAALSLRKLGHGDDSAFDALDPEKTRLDKALQGLPPGSPLAAQFKALSQELDQAKTTLLAGTDRAGSTPRAAIALMNNLANNPLGRLPDDDLVATQIDHIAQAATQKGANPTQVQALKDALGLAYELRSQGASSAESLASKQQQLSQRVRDAGPLAGSARSLFERVSKDATQRLQASATVDPTQQAGGDSAAALSDIIDKLKVGAKLSEISGLPEGLDTLKSMLDASSKGAGVEGLGSTLGVGASFIKGLVELVKERPELAPAARQLFGKLGSGFQGVPDGFSLASNLSKVVMGTDLDGKPVSTTDRIRAAGEMGLENGPSLIADIGTVFLGEDAAVVALANAPPLAIAGMQYKLMADVMDRLAQMKTSMAMHGVRERFSLGKGDDAQFAQALDSQMDKVLAQSTSNTDRARKTAQYLLREHFKNPDTAARFQAYASLHLRGGAQTVDALMKGQRPPTFRDLTSPDVRGKEGVEITRAVRELQTRALEFYKLEISDERSQVDTTKGSRSGDSYMVTDRAQQELKRRLPQRY